MRFVYHPEFVGTAFKAAGFAGTLGGVGPAAQNGVLAFASMDAQRRFFTVWLYDDEGRTHERQYPFTSVPIEDGGPHGISEIHVTGSPAVVVHDGVVKVLYAQYRHTEPADLFRLNTGWRLEV